LTDLKLFNELKDIVNGLDIFDSHEHLMYESERRQKEIDFFIIFNAYTNTSMISAGLTEKDAIKLRDPQLSPEIKWQIFGPFWELIKHTDDANVIKIAAKDIFEVDEINLKGIKKINEKICKFNNSDYYKLILNKKCRIKYILNDIDRLEEYGITKIEPDYDYFLPVIRLDYMLDLNSAEKLIQIEKENDICLNRFSDFLEIVDINFEKRKEKIYALKTAIAYSRSLNFGMAAHSDAEKIFIKILNLNNFCNRRIDSISQDEIKILQDYTWHYLLNKAVEYNLPVQIHTGILDENANDIRNSNPTYLINLFLRYKNVTFDIFHLGYPYTDELITVVKTFPNVYMNMCWIPQFSSQLYKDTLKLLIEILPANKTFGFGGDYLFPEGTYSAQKIARDIITKVLSEKVTDKNLSIEEAARFAERLLYKNAADIYLKGVN
jgi:uncharacterized protein